MNAAARSRQIRQVKAAARALWDGDEAAERDTYEALTGLRRVSEMSDAQLCQVGDYMAAATGRRPTSGAGPVPLRPNSSGHLSGRLARYAALPAPGGWKLNPLTVAAFWRRQGVDGPRPWAHLDRAEQHKLHRAAVAMWGPLEAAERAASNASARCADHSKPAP